MTVEESRIALGLMPAAVKSLVSRAVARTLIGGVYIHIFMFCPTSFFSNQIQIDQFEKKSVGQNMNI